MIHPCTTCNGHGVVELTGFEGRRVERCPDCTDQRDAEIARLTAEVARLTDCMERAGLACFMRGKKPEEIADHMQRVAISVTEELKFATAYKDAIEDECVAMFVCPEATPRETLRKLIDWHVMVALDPQVSAPARKMLERAETAERERDEARIEIGVLVWNLAGCGTIAESGKPQEFNRGMARPALMSVNDMAAKLQTAERELAALRGAVAVIFGERMLWLRNLDEPGNMSVACSTDEAWITDEHAAALKGACE